MQMGPPGLHSGLLTIVNGNSVAIPTIQEDLGSLDYKAFFL
jgi:hypothetical protein